MCDVRQTKSFVPVFEQNWTYYWKLNPHFQIFKTDLGSQIRDLSPNSRWKLLSQTPCDSCDIISLDDPRIITKSSLGSGSKDQSLRDGFIEKES